MAKYKTAKNMLAERDQYNAYYGDFRGVDFSSDHTQVHDSRFAYAVNMYKDYQSGQGIGIETVPGFRRRFEVLDNAKAPVYGIHQINFLEWYAPVAYVHVGKELYLWPRRSMREGLTEENVDVNILKWATLTLRDEILHYNDSQIQILSSLVTQGAGISVESIHKKDGTDVTACLIGADDMYIRLYYGMGVKKGDTIKICYRENMSCVDSGLPGISAAKFSEMNEKRSISFVFNNRLYILDGKNYVCLNGPLADVSPVTNDAYIPTTYINVIAGGANRDGGTQFENRNMLSPLFKETFRANGEENVFQLSEGDVEGVESVVVYDVPLPDTAYTVDLEKGTVTLDEAPKAPVDAGFPENHSGVIITVRNAWCDDRGAPIENNILKCTVATVYDNRVFLSGNPDCPNRVFWSALNDPTYFPSVNWVDVGVGDSPVTALLAVADRLMVLRSDTYSEGAVYYLTPTETGDDLYPVKYVSVPGLAGVGCLGASVNFLDDPIFISKLGVEAVGQLSVRLERAIEHRSSLIDSMLVNMPLEDASIAEWNGYLALLVDGKMFLADSRQRYTHSSGVMQYEWYYLEDIGVWDGQYVEYRYATSMSSDMLREDGTPAYKVVYCPNCRQGRVYRYDQTEYEDVCSCGMTTSWVSLPLGLAPENMRGEVANPPDADGKESEQIRHKYLTVGEDSSEAYSFDVFYHVREIISPYSDEIIGYEALLCDTRENYTGGIFRPATVLAVIEGNLYFGTENGVVCSFNFDKRNDLGEIPKEYYSFDGRTIFCGCATKMDNCGIPHLTKNTVKKSTVIKTKTMQTSGAKIKVRTNRRPYEQIARISGGSFSFDNMDFSDFTFVTTEQNLYAVKEKEKKWVEKQYFLYSDEFMKPFSLYYIAYRYHVAGRYKESK